MMNNWNVKKLSEVCDFEGGSQPAKTFFSNVEKEGYIRLIQIRDYKSDKHIVYIPRDKAKRFCEENDIMIGRYGPPVFQILSGLQGAYNVALMKAIPKKDKILRDYLFLFLKYSKIQDYIVHLSQRAAGQTGVNKKALESYPILIPPIKEQQRIVAILDEALASIDKSKNNAEKNLENGRELFDSYLQTVDSVKVPLKVLVDIKTGKLDANAATENGEYPFFTCSRQIFAIDKFAFDCEAILLAGNNAVGDFNVKHYKGKFNAYQRTYVITVNEESRVLYRYLYFQLLRSLKEFKEKSVGAGTKFLKIGTIQDMEIPLPLLKDQQQIVTKLDALSVETKKLEAIYQKKLTNLEELKKSILQKAFNGEL
jgi:type I restriction enzyme S subunit